MAKKHKNIKKENKLEWNDNMRWGIALIVIFIFILFNILGTRSLILKAWNKLRPTPTPTPSPKVNISPAEGLSTDQANYVKLAIDTLSSKLKIKKDNIVVISVKDYQWNDSSLGCPQKGKLYIQAITPGYLIELSVAGKNYIYHGGLNRVVSC